MIKQHRVLTERQMAQLIKAKADLERAKEQPASVECVELTEEQKREREAYIKQHGCPF